MKKLTKDEFVARASIVHKNWYTYDNSVYEGVGKLISILCPTHGEFYQVAGAHLAGKGCPACSKLNNPSYKPKPIVDVIKDFQLVHGNKYTYIGILDYKNSHTKIKMLCNTTGHVFQQTPSNHLAGKGCNCCAWSGFDKTKPAILYYLSINNGQAYKIGITNRTVDERFSALDLEKIKVLSVTQYDNGIDALNEESRIKKLNLRYRYIGPALLKDGNTELFNIDILQKDSHE